MTKGTEISRVVGRQILDSRGRPTVEVEIELAGGAWGRGAVPSGASTGRCEAHELRDGDDACYGGRGVLGAVFNVNTVLAPLIKGRDGEDQHAIDEEMRLADATPDLSRLGANAILGVSLALCQAVAAARGEPLYRRIARLAGVAQPMLPVPMVNILSGGLHAGRGMDVQDFLAVPIGAASYSEALHMTGRIRDVAAHVADRRGLSTLLADEGGLSPGCPTAVAALDFMMATIEHAGLKPGRDVAIAIDVAANGLARADGGYVFPHEGRRCSGPEMVDLIASWIARYPIVSIEDGLHEEDWALWAQMTRRLGDVVQIVGDDLFTTNPERICKGLARGAANSVLVKLNQNGTVSGTLEAMETARSGGLRTVVSARSGETEDSFIADLAVGTAAGQIKIGSLRSSERLAKYNQLLRIEEDDMPYAGTAAPPLAVRDIASVGV